MQTITAKVRVNADHTVTVKLPADVLMVCKYWKILLQFR
jgi:hypothetical protein